MSQTIISLGNKISSLGRRLENTRKFLSEFGFQNETEDLAAVQYKVEKRLQAAFNTTVAEGNNPTYSEEDIGIKDGKIPMIKAYRERTGAGLSEAKQICEKHFEKKGFQFKPYQ